MAKSQKGGKKNRKYGRHTSRSPAAARYRGEQRWSVNKRRHIEKQKRIKEMKRKQFASGRKTPHGTARAKRRKHMVVQPAHGKRQTEVSSIASA